MQNKKDPLFTKHYNDMNRAERRKYKKWLHANEMWDGAEVVDRLTKKGKLIIHQDN